MKVGFEPMAVCQASVLCWREIRIFFSLFHSHLFLSSPFKTPVNDTKPKALQVNIWMFLLLLGWEIIVTGRQWCPWVFLFGAGYQSVVWKLVHNGAFLDPGGSLLTPVFCFEKGWWGMQMFSPQLGEVTRMVNLNQESRGTGALFSALTLTISEALRK